MLLVSGKLVGTKITSILQLVLQKNFWNKSNLNT